MKAFIIIFVNAGYLIVLKDHLSDRIFYLIFETSILLSIIKMYQLKDSLPYI